ncbi:hypothetical protein C8K30_1061, partial [Promicromonospora sp. AC04]
MREGQLDGGTGSGPAAGAFLDDGLAQQGGPGEAFVRDETLVRLVPD